jgi:hypothetical protein
VTESINKIAYRQFNYQRLMKCSVQLSRWLINQLVLKYTQASMLNSFDMRFTTIRRDSGLLSGYSRVRDAVAKLDESWEEIKSLGTVTMVNKQDQRGSRGEFKDVVYTIYPSREFVAEQKAANRRQNDSKATTPVLIDLTLDKQEKQD